MSIISILTTVIMGILGIGLLLAFFRGWKKSLIRLGLVALALIVSIVFTPMISSSFIEKFTDGTTISIFSLTINFEEVLASAGEGIDLSELLGAGSTTNELAYALMNIVINLVLFILLFIVISLVSLIIYWIVCLIVKIKTRYDEKPEIQRNGKYWGLKALSMFIGLVGSFVICFVIMTPVFGVMDVCNTLIEESAQSSEDTANAATPNSFICGNLYYTEDENIGKIEEYIEKYAVIKNQYDSSFIGKFMNFTGLSKVGGATFDRLTTVKQGGLNVKLTDEFVNIAQAYNSYKVIFVKGTFDETDNNDIDALVKLYDQAIESEIIKNYVVELVPTISKKWSNGEKFLGIECPISGDWGEVLKDTLAVFKIDNITRISNNLKAVANAVKVANNNGVIKAVKENQKIQDIILENDKFVKEEVLVLTSTNELKENISIILNDVFEVLYKQMIGVEKDFSDNVLTVQDIATLNQTNGWVQESENIQTTVSSISDIYTFIKNGSESEDLLDQLEKLGKAIDSARNSKLISKPFKTFIYDLIDNKINFKDEIKEELLNNINNKCDDAAFSYQSMFKAVQEAAKLAKDITEGLEDVSLDNLADTLGTIIENESV